MFIQLVMASNQEDGDHLPNEGKSDHMEEEGQNADSEPKSQDVRSIHAPQQHAADTNCCENQLQCKDLQSELLGPIQSLYRGVGAGADLDIFVWGGCTMADPDI